MIHTSFYTGSKIRVIFKDGTQLIAKYREHKKNLIFTDKGKLKLLDIRSIGYYKPFPHERLQ